MSPREVLEKWIEALNRADVETVTEFYAQGAINHQVANEPVVEKKAIKQIFENDFAQTEMVCIIENIFADGDWAIPEWKDPKGLRGCCFFQIIDSKTVF